MGGMTYTMTDTTKLSTAECYGIALCELGEEHKDVVALTADLAKSTKIGMFGEHFPDRFFNVGIAEQNLSALLQVWLKTVLCLSLQPLLFLQRHALLTKYIQIFAIKMFL